MYPALKRNSMLKAFLPGPQQDKIVSFVDCRECDNCLSAFQYKRHVRKLLLTGLAAKSCPCGNKIYHWLDPRFICLHSERMTQ